MPRLRLLPKTDEWPGWRIDAIGMLILAAGFGMRYRAAAASFVDPGEACQALLAAPDTLRGLWLSALRWPEPPLFLLLLHYVRDLAPADLGLRLIPLAAGTLLPWAVYRWIGRSWGRPAGLAALAMLSLAPGLIRLSAEARADSLTLLFMAGALCWLDRALARSSAWRMAAFAACLWGAILSGFAAAYFTVAAAVYFLFRSRGERPAAGVWIVWGFSQAGAAALYALLWTTQLQALRAVAASAPSAGGWPRHACPPAEQSWVFCELWTAAVQGRLPLRALVPAAAAILLFVAGLYFVWRRPPGGAVWHGRAMAALLVIPVLGACGSPAAALFPYRWPGDAVLLALFGTAGVAIALGRIARRWIAPLTLIAAVAVAVWHGVEGPRQMEEVRKEWMEQALDFLKRSAPPGTVILTEGELRVVLAYYLEPEAGPPETRGGPSEKAVGGWRMFANRWEFRSLEDLRTDLRLLRARYGLGPEVRVWVLDGGFEPGLGPDLEALHRRGELPHFYRFGRAMAIALTPPRFLWEGSRSAQAQESPRAGAASPAGAGSE